MWTVFAPIGNRINVTFSHFDVEDPHTNGTCIYDFVEIAQKEFEDVSSRHRLLI
jgi:cubilin